MIELSVSEVGDASGAELHAKYPAQRITGFSTDTRTIKPHEYFVAIKGNNFNGHDFIQKAIEKGAGGVIAEKHPGRDLIGRVDQLILVDDTTRALGDIAGYIRQKKRIPVISITGTNGKTTLKEMLYQVLSSRFKPLKSAGSYNNIIGLSLTMFELEDIHDIAVLEIGTNHPGEILALADIASPDMAVITNIGMGHLEFFKNKEGVFKEKISLVEKLKDGGTAFLNGDDEYLARFRTSKKIEVKYFGSSPSSDFRISGISRRDNGHAFCVNEDEFFIPLEGAHNVYNAAAAVSIASHLGMDHASIRKGLENIVLPKMRLEKTVRGGITFINDSYNANPDSFESALVVLKELAVKGKKIVIAGDMLELGEGSDQLHRKVGASIAKKGVDLLITVGKRAKFIASGAIEFGMDKNMVFSTDEKKEAARAVRDRASSSDVVLLKASRGVKLEEILECFTTCCSR